MIFHCSRPIVRVYACARAGVHVRARVCGPLAYIFITGHEHIFFFQPTYLYVKVGRYIEA
jgi:hypothetical protein